MDWLGPGRQGGGTQPEARRDGVSDEPRGPFLRAAGRETGRYRHPAGTSDHTGLSRGPAQGDEVSAKAFSPAEREDLIDDCLPQVKRLASRLASRLPPHVDLENLVQAGLVGLLDAMDKFDRERGVRFWTYAEIRIRGAMLDSLRHLDWIPRSVRRRRRQIEAAFSRLESVLGRCATDEELAQELGVDAVELGKILYEVRGAEIGIRSVEDLGDKIRLETDENSRDPHVQMERKEMRQLLAEIVEALPERERFVVTLYYHEELTMKEVGEALGVSESRVSQIHSKAVLRMKGQVDHRLRAGVAVASALRSAASAL
jgi:RNA polymerase sigma factor for flagellar operon FliA